MMLKINDYVLNQLQIVASRISLLKWDNDLSQSELMTLFFQTKLLTKTNLV